MNSLPPVIFIVDKSDVASVNTHRFFEPWHVGVALNQFFMITLYSQKYVDT